MVMHCGVKRKLSCLSEGANHNGELHQQTLLDLSVQKLQEEQIKHGIEPRLLRFVLINNAIKSLQSHLMIMNNDNDDDFIILTNSCNDSFLSNTLNHGLLSSPSSPLTPAKVPKMDTDHFISNSPLVSNNSLSTLGCSEVDNDNYNSSPIPSEQSKDSSLNCKRNNDLKSLITNSDSEECQRKRPRPLTIDQLPQPDEPDEDFPSPTSESSSSSSLSPIDFAKVDVSLYDFDARTNLGFPQVIETPRHLSTPSGLSCSRQAQTITSSTKLEHLDETQEDDDRLEDDDAINDNNDDSHMTMSSSSGSSSVNSLSPEGFDNFDDTHEIDRIVSLLMA